MSPDRTRKNWVTTRKVSVPPNVHHPQLAFSSLTLAKKREIVSNYFFFFKTTSLRTLIIWYFNDGGELSINDLVNLASQYGKIHAHHHIPITVFNSSNQRSVDLILIHYSARESMEKALEELPKATTSIRVLSFMDFWDVFLTIDKVITRYNDRGVDLLIQKEGDITRNEISSFQHLISTSGEISLSNYTKTSCTFSFKSVTSAYGVLSALNLSPFANKKHTFELLENAKLKEITIRTMSSIVYMFDHNFQSNIKSFIKMLKFTYKKDLKKKNKKFSSGIIKKRYKSK